jgi:O-antigen ligase
MAKWGMYCAGFLLYAFHFREQRWQYYLVKTLVFTGSILVLVTAVPYVLQLEISRTAQFEIRLPSMLGELRRFSSTYYQPNHLGAYLGFLLSLQFGTIFAARKYRMLPISTWTFPVIIGTGFILTLSRGAWIAFAVTVLAGLAITRKNTRVYRILLIIVFMAFLSQVALPSELLPARLRDLLNLESSDLLARMSLWRGAWDMFRNSPLLGVGVGNFGPLYWHFWERDMLYVEAQWAVSAHNMYLQILATSGVLGFTAFILLLLHFFKKSYNLVKVHMNTDSLGLYLGLFLAFIFFCCHGFVDNYYSYIPSFLPFFITLALIQAAQDK